MPVHSKRCRKQRQAGSGFRATWLAVLLVVSGCDTSAAATWSPLGPAREVRELRAELAAVETELAGLPEPRVVAQAHQRFGFHGRPGDPAWITLDLGRGVRPDEVVLFPARVSDPAPDDPVGGFPPDVRCLLSASGEDGSFAVMSEWREHPEGAGRDLPLLRLQGNGETGRFLRIEVRGARVRARGRFFALGEVVVLEGGANRALGAPVTASPAIENPPRWSAGNLTDGFLWCGSLLGIARSPSNGFHSAIEQSPDAVPKWVEVDLGAPVAIEEIRLVPARPADFADVAGFGFPPTFEVVAFADESDRSPVVWIDSGGQPFPNPGDATVCLPGKGVSARRVRVVATSLWQRSRDYIFALGELEVIAGGRNVAAGKEVRASDAVTTGIWSLPALVDGFSSQRELLEWPAWLDAVGRRALLEGIRDDLRARLARAEEDFHEALMRGSLVAVASLVLGGGGVLLASHWHQTRLRAQLRQRIARDLHDEVGSQLSHLALLAELGGRKAGSPGAAEAFTAIAGEARDLQHTMRDLVWLLEPQSGAARDFAARLRATCQRLLAPAVAEVRIESGGEPPAMRLPIEWVRDVLLFVKEALNNCARHSAAKTATIRIQWRHDAFVWSLDDDGRGFDDTAPDFQAGAGLRNLRLRAESLRGACVVDALPGRGTRIELRAPLPRRRWGRLFSGK